MPWSVILPNAERARRLRTGVLWLGMALALPASAHDTWFAWIAPTPIDEPQLLLGTGNRFPVTEIAVDIQYFAKKSGCRGADGMARALVLQRYTETFSVLRPTPAVDRAAALSCAVELDAFEIELAPDKIEIYFKEIRPSAAVLEAWAGLRARGLPFRERYVKSARIERGHSALSREPRGTAMDVLRLAPEGPLTVASEATFQVLRMGQPLANFNVELINERSAVGLWQRTDAQGHVRLRLPLPGRWLLRGTDLRLSTRDATRWDSQFITYAFDVAR